MLQALNVLCCPGISVHVHGPPLFSRMDLRLLTDVQNKTRGKYYNGGILYFLVPP